MEHWRKVVHADYLAGDELVNQKGEFADFTLTIKEITSKEVVDPRTGAKKPCGVIYFEKMEKGMILNITNGKTIAKVTSTHVTCTYDDGSYCVPCVLMAC